MLGEILETYNRSLSTASRILKNSSRLGRPKPMREIDLEQEL